MHTEIMRSLAIRHAPLFDQPHSLKLELACKLPSLHHAPPVPSKHLTRCLRNRVQAINGSVRLSTSCAFFLLPPIHRYCSSRRSRASRSARKAERSARAYVTQASKRRSGAPGGAAQTQSLRKGLHHLATWARASRRSIRSLGEERKKGKRGGPAPRSEKNRVAERRLRNI